MPAPAGVDMELEHVFLEVGVLPAMVTLVVEPEGESAMTPAGYPVRPHSLKRAGAAAIGHCLQYNIVGGHVGRVRSEAFAGGCYAACGAVVPGSSGGTLYGGYGLVASTYYSGHSGTPAVGDMQCLHVVQ